MKEDNEKQEGQSSSLDASVNALAEVLAALLPKARKVLADQLKGEIHNWRGRKVGRIAAGAALEEALATLATPRHRAERAAR